MHIFIVIIIIINKALPKVNTKLYFKPNCSEAPASTGGHVIHALPLPQQQIFLYNSCTTDLTEFKIHYIKFSFTEWLPTTESN